MNTNLLDKLISNSGFSKTYERERLEQLVLYTVQECVKQLSDLHYSQTINNQNYPSAWHDGVDSSVKVIKEYFEVIQ